MIDLKIRRQVLGAVAAAGPVSTAELSRWLGVTDHRLDYHLDRLLEDGRVAKGPDGWTPLRPESADVVLPDRVVVAFRAGQQEASEGLYGDAAVVAGGEHRSRISTIRRWRSRPVSWTSSPSSSLPERATVRRA